MHPDLRRAIAFEESLRERCAERIVPFRFGRALFNDTYSAVWDLNVLRVDDPRGATAEALANEAERLQHAAGLAHRRVAVPDEGAGERLAAGFAELGWQPGRFLLMAWGSGHGPRQTPEVSVEEVEAAAVRPLREEIIRAEPWGTDDEVVRMVADSAGLVGRAAHARHFAVLVDGEAESAADLYSDGRTAQVEDVATRARARGRGYASAIVLRAVAEALAGGHDLVFLIAGDEDWPKELYARLGFEPLGRKWTFLRPPGVSGSP